MDPTPTPIPPLPRGTLKRLGLACAAVALAGALHRGHPHFAFEERPGAVGALGFAAAIALVFAARGVRKALHRPVDYYDR